jgi:hypothetical protein
VLTALPGAALRMGLSGIALTSAQREQPGQPRRMLDLLLDGLRFMRCRANGPTGGEAVRGHTPIPAW